VNSSRTAASKASFHCGKKALFESAGPRLGVTKMRRRILFAALALMVLPAMPAAAAGTERFAIYYSDSLSADHFKPYQLVVLDGTHHPSIPMLKEEDKTILGYVSLGEINQASPYFTELKAHNLVLQENPNWKGNYFIDVRDPAWAKLVLEEIVPSVLRQGFDGVFLDTLDDTAELERSNPGKYAGMTDAAVHLIEGIRLNYPSAKIMMNRTYALLPKVDRIIDMELGESVYTNYNFSKKTYGKVDAVAYRDQVTALQAAQHDNPDLKIFTLDYADPSDQSDIKDIYRIERTNGFIPYVATTGLDRLVDEPESN
jgi:polysaccharide biosynthesis protein PelA